MKTLNRKEVGKLGEDIAVKYLEGKGYKILERNYSPSFIKSFKKGKGEIDIVAKPRRNIFDILRGKIKDTICFVEVKSIIGESQDFPPELRVDFFKQRKLIKNAKIYLLENKIPQNINWQIDVISLKIDLDKRKAKLRHFKNAISEM